MPFKPRVFVSSVLLRGTLYTARQIEKQLLDCNCVLLSVLGGRRLNSAFDLSLVLGVQGNDSERSSTLAPFAYKPNCPRLLRQLEDNYACLNIESGSCLSLSANAMLETTVAPCVNYLYPRARSKTGSRQARNLKLIDVCLSCSGIGTTRLRVEHHNATALHI